MIRYRKAVTVKLLRNNEWVIESDLGQRFEMMEIKNLDAPITYWWDAQHQSDLRLWQKDAVIKTMWDAFGPLNLFLVYEKGGGYSQPHDITIAKFNNIWFLSTGEDTWITEDANSQVWFKREDSLGSILDKTTRQQLYAVADGVKHLE